MYKSFLWDPGIEIETMAMITSCNGSHTETKESNQVIVRINKDAEEKNIE